MDWDLWCFADFGLNVKNNILKAPRNRSGEKMWIHAADVADVFYWALCQGPTYSAVMILNALKEATVAISLPPPVYINVYDVKLKEWEDVGQILKHFEHYGILMLDGAANERMMYKVLER